VDEQLDIEKQFIAERKIYMKVDSYLQRYLSRAGYIGAEILKTPIGMRIIIYSDRPAMVIGRKGMTIKEIARILEQKFGLENPQIDVVPIQNPDLNAKIMAYRIARAIVRGVRFRRAAFIALRRIMAAGARGAEIIISGKLGTSGRARFEKFRSGVVIKSGEPGDKLVDEASVDVLLKPGMYGIKVRIMPPLKRPDEFTLKESTGV